MKPNEYIEHVSTCVPAVRMFIIEAAFFENEKPEIEVGIHPVLALRTEVVVQFYGQRTPDHYEGLTYMLQDGWKAEQDVRTIPLFVDPLDDRDTVISTIDLQEVSNVNFSIVAANWPVEEDAERLKPFIKKVEEACLRKCESRKLERLDQKKKLEQVKK